MTRRHHPKLVDSVLESILKSISNGEYKPGDFLPSQDSLKDSLEVSRNTLREALARLELMGIVEAKHGRGVVVKTIDVGPLLGTILPFTLINQKSLQNLIEARKALEMQGVALAADRASKEDISILKSLIEQMGNSLENAKLFTELDGKFHNEILRASQNTILEQLHRVIFSLVMEQLKLIAEMPEVRKISFAYHKKIYYAIEAKDIPLARSLMEEHLENVPSRFYGKK